MLPPSKAPTSRYILLLVRKRSAGDIVVCASRLEKRIDPLTVFAAADPNECRSLWMCTSMGSGLAGVGVAEAIEPSGPDRFSMASVERTALAARVRFFGPDDAPAPVLMGGFSFDCLPQQDTNLGEGADNQAGCQPVWERFGDCRLVLAELTLIDREDSTWILAAGCVGPEDDEESTRLALEQRIKVFTDSSQQLRGDHVLHTGPQPNEHRPPHEHPAELPESWSSGVDLWDDEGAQLHRPDCGPDRIGDICGVGCSRLHGDCSGDHSCSCADSYLKLAAAGVAAVERGELDKVVLARTVPLTADVNNPAATAAVLQRLRHRNPACAVFAFAIGDSVFFGATPEKLAVLDDSQLRTVALAGTAARGDTPAEDRALADELLTSAKNLAEHRVVVDSILDSLAELGFENPEPGTLSLLRLFRVQQLCTPITVQFRRSHSCEDTYSGDTTDTTDTTDATDAADSTAGNTDSPQGMDVIRMAGKLHPTPAAGGKPAEDAIAFIAEREGFDRGWYAAPIGWVDLQGHGEMWVALRSGLATPKRTWLFAGAGIVAGSVPADELQETNHKMHTLLEAVTAVSGDLPAAGISNENVGPVAEWPYRAKP